MRESAQAMRQGQQGDQQESGAAGEIARALDKVADQLGTAGERDAETSRLSDQLSRAQELRDRLGRLQRTMEEIAKTGEGQQGQQPDATQPGSEGKEGATGQQGSSAGGRDGKLSQLQREADSQMREAQKLAEEMQRENPGMQKGGSTPEQWQRSVSAPGTEGFKQDFANWESLKNNLLVALDRTESQLSDQLRARESRERLNAGRHETVADTYKALVDRYYQSLAAPRRQNR